MRGSVTEVKITNALLVECLRLMADLLASGEWPGSVASEAATRVCASNADHRLVCRLLQLVPNPPSRLPTEQRRDMRVASCLAAIAELESRQ